MGLVQATTDPYVIVSGEVFFFLARSCAHAYIKYSDHIKEGLDLCIVMFITLKVIKCKQKQINSKGTLSATDLQKLSKYC